MEIKVLTFNIHHGKGIDGKLNLERIAKVIEDSKADIIGLNEVDRYFSRRSGNIDQLGWLSERLGMNQAFGETISLKSSMETGAKVKQYGNALLSRFPIVFQNNHVFDVSPRKIEGRALLEVHLDIYGQPLTIFATHLSLNPFKQNKQADLIIKKIVDDHQPVILVGDLNMRTGTKTWKKLSGTVMDVCNIASKAPCYTFPSFRPKIQLDYIFVSQNFNIISVQVIKQIPTASDHLPLHATLNLII